MWRRLHRRFSKLYMVLVVCTVMVAMAAMMLLLPLLCLTSQDIK